MMVIDKKALVRFVQRGDLEGLARHGYSLSGSRSIEKIRSHIQEYQRDLFDFEKIESYETRDQEIFVLESAKVKGLYGIFEKGRPNLKLKFYVPTTEESEEILSCLEAALIKLDDVLEKYGLKERQERNL